MKINFINQTSYDTSFHEKIIKKIFKHIKEKKEFNIIFVTNEEIQRINREYRNKDSITDVISFALNDSEDDYEMADLASKELGDIFICIDKAIIQAEEYGHSVAREMGFLAVHGYLHLSGYDHMTAEDEKVMFGLQEEILAKAKLKREV